MKKRFNKSTSSGDETFSIVDENSTSTFSKMAQKKKEYQERIVNFCGKSPRPLNVAIIGGAGVGKSSLINTIGTALSNDTWREHAYTGCYDDANQITVFMQSYPKCCHGDTEEYSRVNLPKLLDIAGFSNELREEFIAELLRILFYGRLPEGDSVAGVSQFYKDHGLESLRMKYSHSDENLKIDRVVVVSAATSRVDTHLLNCIVLAARPSGIDQGSKRTIPIFGVMTKSDQVGSEVISEEDYETREKQFVSTLGLQGASHRFLRCSNYCDEVDGGSRSETSRPDLELPVLRFLCQLCDPVIKVINEGQHEQHEAEWAFMTDMFKCILNFCVEILLFWLLLQIAVPAPYSGTLKAVCAFMKQKGMTRDNQGYFNDFMESCGILESAWSKQEISILIVKLFLFVRLGGKFGLPYIMSFLYIYL